MMRLGNMNKKQWNSMSKFAINKLLKIHADHLKCTPQPYIPDTYNTSKSHAVSKDILRV